LNDSFDKVECCFDKVERCFDIVAGVDGALRSAHPYLLQSYINRKMERGLAENTESENAGYAIRNSCQNIP